jgi:hypothetical protein
VRAIPPSVSSPACTSSPPRSEEEGAAEPGGHDAKPEPAWGGGGQTRAHAPLIPGWRQLITIGTVFGSRSAARAALSCAVSPKPPALEEEMSERGESPIASSVSSSWSCHTNGISVGCGGQSAGCLGAAGSHLSCRA